MLSSRPLTSTTRSGEHKAESSDYNGGPVTPRLAPEVEFDNGPGPSQQHCRQRRPPMLASVPRQRTMTLPGKDHCVVQAVGRRARLTALIKGEEADR